MGLRGGPIRSSASAGSVPGWRTEDFLRFVTDFLQAGVVQGVGGELAVTQRGAGANMSVDVAAGRALIEFTTTLLSPNETQKSWLTNDAVLNIAVPAADLTNPRIDRIVAKYDVSTDPNTAASNHVSIELVAGTPAGSPAAPAEPSNAKTLALLAVAASATSITNANITDSRTYVKFKTTVLTDAARTADLASNVSGKGASMISIEDAAGNFTATNLEAALLELFNSIGEVSDTAYDPTSWNGVTTVAPSKNAVRDKIETLLPNTFEAGTVIIANAPTERTAQNTAYTKKKEVIVNMSGTVRVVFDAQRHASGTGKARIYVNGVAVGTERTLGATYATYTEDISVSAGDLVQLYLTDNMTNFLVSCREFSVKVLKAPNAFVNLD